MNRIFYLMVISSILLAVPHSDVECRAAWYSITDLGVDSIALDINNSGQVVGTYEPDPIGYQIGFYWDSIRGRENIDLGGHGGLLKINDVGEAIQLNWFHPPKGRIWNSTNGEIIEIPIFPKAINNSRIVTGSTGDGPGGGDLVVTWDETNGIQAIGGGVNGNGNDVNTFGTVAGRGSINDSLIGFVWNNSIGLQAIPTLGGNKAEAYAINDLGQVVGISDVASSILESHAFLWDETIGIQDLGTLGYPPPGLPDRCEGRDINIHGQVVGRSFASSSSEGAGGLMAFIWDSDNGMQDLNNLIPPDSGWILGVAYAINDLGQIVGWGTYDGEPHAFLLNPTLCQSDYNDDGRVDENDLRIFSFTLGVLDCTWWPPLCVCDSEGDDNDIDGADLFVLTDEFNRTNCP